MRFIGSICARSRATGGDISGTCRIDGIHCAAHSIGVMIWGSCGVDMVVAFKKDS